MSSKRAERQRRVILSGLLFALTWVLAPTRVTANQKSQLPKQGEACLACHGTPGMKSEKGKDIYINPSKHAASAHALLGCQDCHTSIKDFPHPAKTEKVQCATCHADEAKAFFTSAHALLGETACATCHGRFPKGCLSHASPTPTHMEARVAARKLRRVAPLSHERGERA